MKIVFLSFAPCRPHGLSHPARRADLALIAHSGVHLSTILIDVTIAFHNSRSADHASFSGSVAKARYAAEATSYTSDYHPPSNDVQLFFFSVETSSVIHCVAFDFLERLFASCCIH